MRFPVCFMFSRVLSHVKFKITFFISWFNLIFKFGKDLQSRDVLMIINPLIAPMWKEVILVTKIKYYLVSLQKKGYKNITTAMQV